MDVFEESLQESMRGLEIHYKGKTIEERAKFALESAYNSLRFCIEKNYNAQINTFVDEVSTLELVVNGIGYTKTQVLDRVNNGYLGYKSE